MGRASWFIELVFYNVNKFREHVLRDLDGTEECIDCGICEVIPICVNIRKGPSIVAVTDKGIDDSQLPSSLACRLVPIDRIGAVDLFHHHICFTTEGNVGTQWGLLKQNRDHFVSNYLIIIQLGYK